MSIRHVDPESGPVTRAEWDAAHVGAPTLWRLAGTEPINASTSAWVVTRGGLEAVAISRADPSTVVPLGFPPGKTLATPYGTSGTWAVGDSETVPFAWNLADPSTPVELGFPPGSIDGIAYATYGSWAVGYIASDAVLWDLTDPAAYPTILGSAPGQLYSTAQAVRGSSIVGTVTVDPSGYFGAVWDVAHPTDAPTLLGGTPGSLASGVIAVDVDGSWVVGQLYDDGLSYAVAWDLADPATPLFPATVTGWQNGQAVGVSLPWIVGYGNNGSRNVALAWNVADLATPILLGDLPDETGSVAVGIAGTVAFGASEVENTLVAWDMADPAAVPTILGASQSGLMGLYQGNQAGGPDDDPRSPIDGDMALGTDGSVWLYAEPDWLLLKAGA